MKVLKIVTVNNENYQIVKLERKEGILEIYFIWGKTDFRTVWLYSDSVWIRVIFKNFFFPNRYFFLIISIQASQAKKHSLRCGEDIATKRLHSRGFTSPIRCTMTTFFIG